MLKDSPKNEWLTRSSRWVGSVLRSHNLSVISNSLMNHVKKHFLSNETYRKLLGDFIIKKQQVRNKTVVAGSWSVVSNAHIQAFAQNLAHLLDSLVRTAKKKRAVGTSTRADACAFTFRALRRNHFVSALFLMPLQKKFVSVWVPGTGGQHMETRVRARTHGTTDT